MANQTDLKLSKLPFFIGDAVLIALSIYICWNSPRLGSWETGSVLVCFVVGSVLMITPFVLEFQALVRQGEAGALLSSLDQIKDLQSLTALISAATARWQSVQELSDKTVGAARSVAERMSSEAAAFTEFLQKANDDERANLRLEVEKLKRAEGEWVQSTVRMLDHTFALHQAALRSGQPGLIEQLERFQGACRDVARRVGLVPYVPATDEVFNPQLHQLADGDPDPACEARIDRTIATGFTFQGRLVRPALVIVRQETSSARREPGSNGKAAVELSPERSMA